MAAVHTGAAAAPTSTSTAVAGDVRVFTATSGASATALVSPAPPGSSAAAYVEASPTSTPAECDDAPPTSTSAKCFEDALLAGTASPPSTLSSAAAAVALHVRITDSSRGIRNNSRGSSFSGPSGDAATTAPSSSSSTEQQQQQSFSPSPQPSNDGSTTPVIDIAALKAAIAAGALNNTSMAGRAHAKMNQKGGGGGGGEGKKGCAVQ